MISAEGHAEAGDGTCMALGTRPESVHDECAYTPLMTHECSHTSVECLNPYEFIRKYRCNSCKAVMMCACDEDFALRFLPHQIHEGTELTTQNRVPITEGFQARICNVCRGKPEEPHPKAPTYGFTSKIERYYWREIYFETTTRMADWCQDHGFEYTLAIPEELREIDKRIRKEVIDEFKERHKHAPKYTYQEDSQHDVLTRNHVEIIDLDGTYLKKSGKKAAVLYEGKPCSVEEFASHHLNGYGYQVLELESIPFHTLFGVFFWLLIQDNSDPRVRMVGFGDRNAFEQKKPGEQIWTFLPEDFGTSGYALRRKVAIDEHFESMLMVDREELLWLFDYWVGPSEDLRQYLWAHRPENISRARELVEIFPPDVIRCILRYLIGNYWERFCGWPDLLAFKDSEFLLVEVKSSNDKLSEDQKRWIDGNSSDLNLPFKIIKIHRKCTVDH